MRATPVQTEMTEREIDLQWGRHLRALFPPKQRLPAGSDIDLRQEELEKDVLRSLIAMIKAQEIVSAGLQTVIDDIKNTMGYAAITGYVMVALSDGDEAGTKKNDGDKAGSKKTDGDSKKRKRPNGDDCDGQFGAEVKKM